ncbi:ABC transporter ATP-binding protein [Agrococcus sediminis]|uniref:ABC transporter ATP-binding protein n=1 Tax=Agrococcus sediminis TaxID=2599924 RepID=A0A5M8QAE2_9MICO|nr:MULTISPECIES: ABC transporter ATP-binding protein [Agrococcus]KAA6432945.1 ABC transporter ATP-binding protein [Agrococcus sediminis]MDR7234221.1 peptide/nickel transport system ATP-binding protein [Agrococcus sp. BE272]RWR22813.1 ABC transporter ATP-binding protein [Agrococcus lahaulensis]UOW00968.1 ABC transporter ATP-binding protein [Agrococcus sp. SCSIO52902]
MTDTAAAPVADRDVILEARDLNVDFWVDGKFYPAVKDAEFKVHAGEVLAIVGESGSGKSTTAMALISLLPPNARVNGSVRLKGKEILGIPERDLRHIRGNEIAVIFQEPMTALNPVYTIGFQISEALRSHYDLTVDQAKERAIELIAKVEIPDPPTAFNKYPHQLSGGQRQRAMIAQSLACDPALLIADEPTTALDVTVQAEVLDLMRKLKDELGSAVILITHDMGVVADLSDRIIVMRNGEMVDRGSALDVFQRPSHPYTKELLAAVPYLGVHEDETGRAFEASKVSDTVDPILRFADVVIEYPKRGRVPAFRAAEDIDLSVYPGEIVGLVGESGSGKTTLGRAAIGLLPIKSGTLTVAGHDISAASMRDLRPLREKTGIVFQDPSSSLNPRMPIGESIGEPILLSRRAAGDAIDHKALDKRVQELLESVELPTSYRNRYPHELSGGQKQRVGIARALALAPELLIADEPTSALDVSVQARFLELLTGIQQELQFACLFISHDLAVVDSLAHRIVVMRKGRIVEEGTRDQILRNPQDAYTQRLISAVPLPDPVAQAERRESRRAS